MTALKMAFHGVTGRRMVEVYDDTGKFVAAIYPGPNGSNAIHIISEHFAEPAIVKVAAPSPFQLEGIGPSYLVKFQ